jgi:hypothetical protein
MSKDFLTSFYWWWTWLEFPWFKKALIYLISSILFWKRLRSNWDSTHIDWRFYTLHNYKSKHLLIFLWHASLMSLLHTSKGSRVCDESRFALRRINGWNLSSENFKIFLRLKTSPRKEKFWFDCFGFSSVFFQIFEKLNKLWNDYSKNLSFSQKSFQFEISDLKNRLL